MKNKNNNPRKNRRAGTVLYWILLFLLLFLTGIIYPLATWYSKNFGVSIEAFIFTILSPIKGADTDFLGSAVLYCIPAVAAALGLFLLIAIADRLIKRRVYFHLTGQIGRRKIDRSGMWFLRGCSLILACVLFFSSLAYSNQILGFSEFVQGRLQRSRIYEDYYVDPDTVAISSGEKRNIICIYLESMETTYASVEDGGNQPEINYIPNLTQLASEEISFSDKELLGGFQSIYGTGWTVAALFATTTGVPFAFPTETNSMNERNEFAAGITGLGDILETEGYHQEFLCGSDAEYGGRALYFRDHGNYEIYDLNRAREEGDVEEDYYIWWGFEDRYLYEIAKKEATRLASEEEPFNLTMLTVDTHHMHGYGCPLCGMKYDFNLCNVLNCADRQVTEFIDWCQEQDWYENTVIVVTGDHPRMDTDLVDGVEYSERTLYNCFINTGIDKESLNLVNRGFTAMDLFPTILSAAGFEIDGERLGLGTNLFSELPTLAEEMGMEELDAQLSKYSNYYLKNFK